MPTISEYNTTLPTLNFKPTDYSIDLDVALLRKKQSDYNQALSKIKSLESRALNIQMLNTEGRQKLDQYNDQLEEELSKDLGDLSKVEVQNKVAGLFQNIASDTSLIKASQLSKQYQNQIDTINTFRQSGKKDKGYNSINESVFMEWDGGYNDFANSSLSKVTDSNFQPLKYVPFKELDTKLLNIAKTLHADSIKRQGATNTGYFEYTEDTGVTPERISQLMQSQFDQEDLEQLDQMAKYEVLRNRKLNSIPDFHQKYSLFSDNEIKRIEAESNKSKQRAEYLESQLKSNKLTPDEKTLAIEQIADLKANQGIYDKKAFSLRQSKKGLSDFEAMSNDELLEYAKEMQWSNKIEGLSNALSWKADVDMYKTDPTFLALKKLDTIRWQENIRNQTKLTLGKQAKEKDEKGPEWGGVGDSVKNKQDIFTSFQNLTSLQEKLANQTNRIITSPFFNKNQLLDQGWTKANANNYEVKMWEIFSKQYPAVKGGEPQVEAFKMWLRDQETNPDTPFIQSQVEEQRRDEYVSDYVDDKVSYINKMSREKLNEFDLLSNYQLRDSSGRPITKEEYNNGVPAYISVPTDPKKSGYKLMKLDDVINDTKNFAKQSGKYQEDITKSGQFRTGVTAPQSYVTNDQGLYDTVIGVISNREKKNQMIRDVLTNSLPQIGQFGMMQSLNKEAIQSKIGDVMGSAKNSDKNKQFGIGVDDIEFVNAPIGQGEYGQFKLKDEKAKVYGEAGWKLPSAADPNSLIDIEPGATYAFKTSPVSPYDTYFNLILEERPWIDYYKGYKIEVSKSSSPSMKNVVFINVYDSLGNKIDRNQLETGADAKNLLEQAKRNIDVLTYKQ